MTRIAVVFVDLVNVVVSRDQTIVRGFHVSPMRISYLYRGPISSSYKKFSFAVATNQTMFTRASLSPYSCGNMTVTLLKVVCFRVTVMASRERQTWQKILSESDNNMTVCSAPGSCGVPESRRSNRVRSSKSTDHAGCHSTRSKCGVCQLVD